jgi:hypothetical protein
MQPSCKSMGERKSVALDALFISSQPYYSTLRALLIGVSASPVNLQPNHGARPCFFATSRYDATRVVIGCRLDFQLSCSNCVFCRIQMARKCTLCQGLAYAPPRCSFGLFARLGPSLFLICTNLTRYHSLADRSHDIHLCSARLQFT